MKRIYIAGILCFFVIGSLAAKSGFSQTIREEKLEKPASWKASNSVAVFSGYDNNVNLSTDRKGDIFQEVLLSLDFSKRLKGRFYLTIDYDIDALNYHEVSNASYVLNHLRLGLHKRFSDLRIGTGYDLGAAFYPNWGNNNFLLHKGFLYLGNYLTDSIYHQLQAEIGLKDYTDRKALHDTISTYQDKKRSQDRLSIEYSLRASIRPKLIWGIKVRLLTNDSNDRYLDYYDYDSHRIMPFAEYSLTEKIKLFADFSIARKTYKSRTLVTDSTWKQKDTVYTYRIGTSYKLSQGDSFILHYTYRNNDTSELLEKYTESMISVGWRHNF
ncbi:hypothetical protein ACFLZ3_02620 [Candidatus Omnitrophota bacterium]